MKITFYKIECLTNLHVGSGDINYNIVDNEVEKDPVTGMPMIHASGIKGAIKDYAKNDNIDDDIINKIFGSKGNDNTSGEGTHKFFDAHLIARPMRVSGSNDIASIPIITQPSINSFVEFLSMFGENTYEGAMITESLDFNNKSFLCNVKNLSVEGEATGVIELENVEAIKKIVGKNFAIAKSYEGYDLPVVARNALENGISKNLWYEEVVPHGSIFYFAIMSPADDNNLDLDGKIIQFGGNASIGCGYTKVTKLGEVNR